MGFRDRRRMMRLKGSGLSYDFGARMYDPRAGRWWSVDAKAEKYPHVSPYNFVLNTPIQSIDPDGEKVFFVNGYYNQGSLSGVAGSVGGEYYWSSKFIEAANNYFGDWNNSYVDGRGKWNSSGQERFDAGYEFAKENATILLEGVVDAEGVQIETIKVVSHSMGSAYAEGMIKYFEERNLTVEKVVHFSAADPSDFNASSKPFTLQLNIEGDAVLAYKNFWENDRISGVDRFGQVKTKRPMEADLVLSHVETKSDPDVFKLLSDLQDISMTITKNVMSFIWGTYSGPSNIYSASGNTHGTEFNTVYLRGTEYHGTDTSNEYRGPMKY
jgi:RHS repeat-associated protein